MRTVRLIAVVAVTLVVSIPAVADDPPAMPEPTAEHQVLEHWVGTWKGSGELKANPFGPGGEASWSDECTWFGGSKFHVVCRSEGTGPTGPMQSLGIMGYHPTKQVYTHYGVDSSGWSGYSEGTRSGDTWTFHSEETMGGVTYHSRFTMTMESGDRMTFSWAMSEDGNSWETLMTGASERVD